MSQRSTRVGDILMRMEPPKAGTDWFSIKADASDGEDAPTNTKVYIYDEIGYWGTSADDFAKQLLAIDTPNIELHLNSPGGQIFDGIAIYNALYMHAAEVSVYIDGLAASAASYIAQAAAPGKLFIASNGTMMIHDGMALTAGNEKDHLDTADVLGKLSNTIASMYAARAGGSQEEWRALMQAETWYNAQEAVDAKLADSKFGATDEKTDQWNLSIFNHAGREDAPSPDEVRQRVFANLSTKGTKVGDNATTDTSGGGGAPTPPTPPAPPAAATNVAPMSITFKLNGSDVTDPVAVQEHINGLEKFQTDTLEEGRKSFVNQLASDNKIAATQIDALEKFALDLSADAYANWTATWDAAPASPLLGGHGGGGSNSSANQNGGGGGGEDPKVARLKNELENARAIVSNHQRSGLPQAKIEQTASWQNVKRLEEELAKLA